MAPSVIRYGSVVILSVLPTKRLALCRATWPDGNPVAGEVYLSLDILRPHHADHATMDFLRGLARDAGLSVAPCADVWDEAHALVEGLERAHLLAALGGDR
jgi:hypothetical protein